MHIWQDNAGCYHCGSTLTTYRHMGCKTGVNVLWVDFSEPQGGKGPCDHKAATIKAHVRRFINEGNNVITARRFRDAIMSSGVVPGIKVALVDAAGLCDRHVEWDSISRQNNFKFADGQITAWWCRNRQGNARRRHMGLVYYTTKSPVQQWTFWEGRFVWIIFQYGILCSLCVFRLFCHYTGCIKKNAIQV